MFVLSILDVKVITADTATVISDNNRFGGDAESLPAVVDEVDLVKIVGTTTNKGVPIYDVWLMAVGKSSRGQATLPLPSLRLGPGSGTTLGGCGTKPSEALPGKMATEYD